ALNAVLARDGADQGGSGGLFAVEHEDAGLGGVVWKIVVGGRGRRGGVGTGAVKELCHSQIEQTVGQRRPLID
ncbi:MAG: hypothetical protein ABJC26_04520, partial [Gemmatimonadaceae bacterium]